MLNQVKDLLGIEAQVEEVKEETPEQTLEETQLNEQEETVVTKVELEQRTLENGTVIEADSFETGKEVFIITEEEKVALPVGDYTLDDGKILKVEEEASIEDATAEDVEEEMAEVADWEGMEKRIQNLEDAVAALKADKISNQEEKEVKEELSEVEKVSHNPETETEKEMNLYAQNRHT